MYSLTAVMTMLEETLCEIVIAALTDWMPDVSL